MNRLSWLPPLVLLAVLLLAFCFRWHYDATKTYEWGVIKWKTDRWDNRKWLEVYNANPSSYSSYFVEVPLDRRGHVLEGDLRRSAWLKRNVATAVWFGATVITGIWLVKRIRPRSIRAEKPQAVLNLPPKKQRRWMKWLKWAAIILGCIYGGAFIFWLFTSTGGWARFWYMTLAFLIYTLIRETYAAVKRRKESQANTAVDKSENVDIQEAPNMWDNSSSPREQ